MKSVVVTGIGFACSIGTSRSQVDASLQNLQNGFVRQRIAGLESSPELVFGKVAGFDVSSTNALEWSFPDELKLQPDQVKSLPPHGPFAILALEQAIDSAQLNRDCISQPDTGLFCASTGSPRLLHHHLSQMERANWRRSHPLGVVSSVSGTLNFNLAAHYAIRGANCGFVSACTSSSHALGYAFDEIALGRQQRMLVVAAEDGNAESLLPFQGLRALSQNLDPNTASRPFDEQRDGFVGSGGGVAMILESATAARTRGANILAQMSGWAQSSDGYHIAAPHPEGSGIRNAMQLCLDRCASSAEQVDWVCAHATSTPAGDRAEALALHASGFGSEHSGTRISSVKGITGHGLSHSGLLEAAICVHCIGEGIIPGNANLTTPDSACQGLDLPTTTTSAPLHQVLNNSSGFGGSNVCHLFRTPE